jgi:hypothetical protein
MIRCTTATIATVVVSSVLFATGAAHAQAFRNARYTSCRDAAGTRVVAVNTTRLHNVGMAGRIRGRPVILFNPIVLRRFQPITRVFWYYHECAHHALGHSLGNRPISRERDADCWAIRQMRRRGLLTAARLGTIQRDLYPLNGDGVLYLPGPQRAAYIGYCATGRRTVPQMVYRNRRQRVVVGRMGGRRPVPRRYVRRRGVMVEGPVGPSARYRYRRQFRGPSGGRWER